MPAANMSIAAIWAGRCKHRQQLEELTTRIYLLDTEKGQLEKIIVLRTIGGATAEELDTIKKQSTELSAQHGHLAGRLLHLQKSLLKQVDEMMLPYKK